MKHALLLRGALAGQSLSRGRGTIRSRAKIYYNGGNFNTISTSPAIDTHSNPYFASSGSNSSSSFVSSSPALKFAAPKIGLSTFGSPRGRGRGRGGFLFGAFRGRGRGRGALPVSHVSREELDAEMDEYFLEPQAWEKEACESGQPVLTVTPRTKRLKSQL